MKTSIYNKSFYYQKGSSNSGSYKSSISISKSIAIPSSSSLYRGGKFPHCSVMPLQRGPAVIPSSYSEHSYPVGQCSIPLELDPICPAHFSVTRGFVHFSVARGFVRFSVARGFVRFSVARGFVRFSVARGFVRFSVIANFFSSIA